MTDPRALDYLRAIDHSTARIATALEQLARVADELATTREMHREEASGAESISAREGKP